MKKASLNKLAFEIKQQKLAQLKKKIKRLKAFGKELDQVGVMLKQIKK